MPSNAMAFIFILETNNFILQFMHGTLTIQKVLFGFGIVFDANELIYCWNIYIVFWLLCSDSCECGRDTGIHNCCRFQFNDTILIYSLRIRKQYYMVNWLCFSEKFRTNRHTVFDNYLQIDWNSYGIGICNGGRGK